MHAKGTFQWANGDVYTGDWKYGHMHGHGKKVMANGDCYVGSWRNDRANGRGVKTFANGDRHEGEYADDKRQGFGIYLWVRSLTLTHLIDIVYILECECVYLKMVPPYPESI